MLGRDEMTLQVPLTGKVNLAKLTPETRQKCQEWALILYQVTLLKGLCHEISNFFEGLKNQISTFCICADSF